jgi:hypothetical protein
VEKNFQVTAKTKRRVSVDPSSDPISSSSLFSFHTIPEKIHLHYSNYHQTRTKCSGLSIELKVQDFCEMDPCTSHNLLSC